MPSPVSRETRRRIIAGDTPLWLANHPRRRYLVALAMATPDWVDRRALKQKTDHAHRLGMVADHIVPLNHPHVCGLNVPWNLRAISYAENAARSNRWWEYTPDMFQGPSQLELQLMGHR